MTPNYGLNKYTDYNYKLYIRQYNHWDNIGQTPTRVLTLGGAHCLENEDKFESMLINRHIERKGYTDLELHIPETDKKSYTYLKKFLKDKKTYKTEYGPITEGIFKRYLCRNVKVFLYNFKMSQVLYHTVTANAEPKPFDIVNADFYSTILNNEVRKTIKNLYQYNLLWKESLVYINTCIMPRNYSVLKKIPKAYHIEERIKKEIFKVIGISENSSVYETNTWSYVSDLNKGTKMFVTELREKL